MIGLRAAINSKTIKTSMIGLKTNKTTAAGLMRPMTTFVAHRLAKRSSRLARVCARSSKSLSDGVSASRYQPVESEDTRRSRRGRMRGDEEGVLGGVVEGVLGSVLFGLTGEERMERVAAGRPVRNREVVFMLAGRSAGGSVASRWLRSELLQRSDWTLGHSSQKRSSVQTIDCK